MVFNDTTNKLGLIQDCEVRLFGDSGYGKISGSTDRLAQFTARINRRQDRFTQLKIDSDGRFQHDDTNHVNANNNPDYPEATENIISGRRDYSFSEEMLVIEKVLIYPGANATDYVEIYPIDIEDPNARVAIENPASNTGIPTSYDKRNGQLLLQPVPNFNSPEGLKVIYKRGAYYFVVTDTTRQPGFPSPYHNYLSAGASLDYAIDRGLTEKINVLTPIVNQMEIDIKKFFSLRNRDEKRVMTPNIENTQ